MNRSELRRLAIRLATKTFTEGGIFFDRCRECNKWVDLDTGATIGHGRNCPIAELEAEEAASLKLSIGGVEIETVPVPAWKAEATIASGDHWSVELIGKWEAVTFDLTDGTSKTGWVRTVPAKEAAKFEGEY